MARRNVAEVLAGAVVLVVAGGFLAFAVAHSGRSTGSGYPLKAPDRLAMRFVQASSSILRCATLGRLTTGSTFEKSGSGSTCAAELFIDARFRPIDSMAAL